MCARDSNELPIGSIKFSLVQLVARNFKGGIDTQCGVFVWYTNNVDDELYTYTMCLPNHATWLYSTTSPTCNHTTGSALINRFLPLFIPNIYILVSHVVVWRRHECIVTKLWSNYSCLLLTLNDLWGVILRSLNGKYYKTINSCLYM